MQGYAAEASWIRSRLLVEWAGRTPVAWDNTEPQKPADGSAWIRPTIRHAGAGQAEIGEAPMYRHDGMVIVEVFTRPEAGDGECNELCDAIASIFRGVRAPGIAFFAPFVMRVGAVEGWFKQDVLCPFVRDTIFAP